MNNDEMNYRTHVIAAAAGFYPGPYFGLPGNYEFETVDRWLRAMARNFDRLQRVRHLFDNGQRSRMAVRARVQYYDLRDAILGFPDDLVQEYFPNAVRTNSALSTTAFGAEKPAPGAGRGKNKTTAAG